MFCLKFKPFGTCDSEELSIENFEDENWDLVYDLFERLAKKFTSLYPSVKITKMENLNPFINIYIQDDDFSEETLSKYCQILSGNLTDNIIFFGEHEFIIRSEIIIDEQKPTFLDKFNDLALDIAPDLTNQ